MGKLHVNDDQIWSITPSNCLMLSLVPVQQFRNIERGVVSSCYFIGCFDMEWPMYMIYNDEESHGVDVLW